MGNKNASISFILALLQVLALIFFPVSIVIGSYFLFIQIILPSSFFGSLIRPNNE